MVPKIHYSTPKTAPEERKRKVGRKTVTEWVLPQLRAHADMIDPIAFGQFLRDTAAGPGLRRDAGGQGPRTSHSYVCVNNSEREMAEVLTELNAVPVRLDRPQYVPFHEHARGHATDRPVPARAQIGAGGMATVYRAFDINLERRMAIKLLHRERQADADQLERFRREARAIAQLAPNVVGVIETG